MRTIIVYGSQYGTAKRYAEALAGKTDSEIKSYEESMDLDAYDNIVLIGALYAGGVLGLKKTLSGIHDLKNKKIIIATVGLADTNDRENTETIRNSLKKQLSENIFIHARIFHLRGGIDYSRLNLKHRTMMALLYGKAKGLPEEKGEGQGTCHPDGGCGILQKQLVHARHGRRQGVPGFPGFCRA